MFKWLHDWLYGELVEVKIIACREYFNHNLFEHMLVECLDGTRKYVAGHQGKAGETIKVHSSQIRMF